MFDKNSYRFDSNIVDINFSIGIRNINQITKHKGTQEYLLWVLPMIGALCDGFIVFLSDNGIISQTTLSIAPYIIIIIIGMYSLYVAFTFFESYRLIKHTTTAKIGSCKGGFVKLVGTQDSTINQIEHKLVGIHDSIANQIRRKLVGTQDPIANQIRQFINKEATWYCYQLEQYRGGRRGSWHTINIICNDITLILKDGTGSCMIDPSNAEIITPYCYVWYGFNANNFSRTFNLFARLFGEYRLIEFYLLPKTYLYALGMFSTKDKEHYLGGDNLAKNQRFLLSGFREEELISKLKVKIYIYMFLSLVVFVFICGRIISKM